MKKVLLLFIVLCLGTFTTFSQNHHRKPWQHKFDTAFAKGHHDFDSIIDLKNHKHDSIIKHKRHKWDSTIVWKHDSIFWKHHRKDTIKPPNPNDTVDPGHHHHHDTIPNPNDSIDPGHHHHDTISPPPPPHDSLNKPCIKVGFIYPNPVQDVLNFDVDAKVADVIITVDILNQKQEVLLTKVFTLASGLQKKTIDVSGFNKGFYALRITGTNIKIVRNFVILK